MELKVWVDGIKRVVCGVTDHTSCQDIVIALAQAMGRTGRFTLIEKWRENERPLAPNECPLLVLQKWGEFANEVKLILYESGIKKKQKLTEKDKMVPRPQDRFTHNFTPPVKTSEAVIRRSLTFSGGRKAEIPIHRKFDANQGRTVHNNHIISKPSIKSSEKVTSDGNSWSSSSSLSSQNSTLMPPHHRRSRSSSHDRSRDRQRPSPQPVTHSTNHGTMYQNSTNYKHQQDTHNPIPVSNNYQNQNHRHPVRKTEYAERQSTNVPVLNGPSVPSVRSSAFSPVQPRRNSSVEDQDMMRVPNVDIPVYTESVKKSSHKAELEEYDLDSNFPDVVKETSREFLIEEYHVPGRQGHGHDNQVSWEEEERVKLLRLVTMQNERIKMQDSQLDIIDTEINSREQKIDDLKLEISRVSAEIDHLSKLEEDQNSEVLKLDNGTLIEEMENEKLTEREIKTEISSLRTRLEKCENDLHQFQTKVKICGEDLERENEVLKTDEKRRKEEELKLQQEISEVQKDLDKRSNEINEKTKVSEKVERELQVLNERLSQKTVELISTEKDLQKENLKFFQEPQQPEPSKSLETNGEAVIKVLEGSLSPHVKRHKILSSPLTLLSVPKNKNGVWV